LSYFAAAMIRRGSEWSADEVDLDDVEDLDGIADAMRVVAGDEPATIILFLEEDDEWFAVVRIDEDSDPRVFVSDGRVVDTSALGAILGEAAVIAAEPPELPARPALRIVGEDEEVDEQAIRIDGDPIGDADVLSDLGTPAARLRELSVEEGKLPADAIGVLCEQAGCLEPLESLRG
jgi:putative tRNA adenosine deaminase-associated protein